MGDYTISQMFENLWRGSQARNFTTNVPKILDLKLSDIFRKLTLGAPDFITGTDGISQICTDHEVLNNHAVTINFSMANLIKLNFAIDLDNSNPR